MNGDEMERFSERLDTIDDLNGTVLRCASAVQEAIEKLKAGMVPELSVQEADLLMADAFNPIATELAELAAITSNENATGVYRTLALIAILSKASLKHHEKHRTRERTDEFRALGHAKQPKARPDFDVKALFDRPTADRPVKPHEA